MKLRILIAAYPEGHGRLKAVLAGHDLAFVETMYEAQAALASGSFDLAAIGTRFDESRMFDLVRLIRTGEKTSSIGIVCFRGILFRRASDKVLVEGLFLGCEALGAAFYDFISFPDDEAGNRAIREIFEAHAAPHRGEA